MDYFGSVPFEAMLLEACQPYCNYQPAYRHQAHQAPQEGRREARRCAPPATARAPTFDASESAEDYKLYIALPGLERKDISINVDEGVLSLAATRPADPALDRFRQVPAKLRRTWKMPESVDASSIRARLANGELVITIPKVSKAEPRQVLIGGDDDDAPAALPMPPAASAARADAPAPAAHAGHAPAAQPAPSAEGAAAQSAATASLLEAVTGVAAAKREEHAAPTSEADGSIEDLSDEEREAERAARRRKALAAEAGPVLMEADEMPAQAA